MLWAMLSYMVRLAARQVPFQQMQPPVDLPHQPELRDQTPDHSDPTEAHRADPVPDLEMDPAQPREQALDAFDQGTGWQ